MGTDNSDAYILTLRAYIHTGIRYASVKTAYFGRRYLRDVLRHVRLVARHVQHVLRRFRHGHLRFKTGASASTTSAVNTGGTDEYRFNACISTFKTGVTAPTTRPTTSRARQQHRGQ